LRVSAAGATTSEPVFTAVAGHIPQLDGFRGLAVLMVIVGHFLQFSAGFPVLGSSLGSLGVLFFFVLSGYLITGLLERERTLTGSLNLKKFYVRRILRLAPALVVFLLVVCALIATRLLSGIPWYEIAACVLYVRNIVGRSELLAHLWTLSLEEQFYTLWPVTMKRISPAHLATITLGLVLVMSLWRGCAIFFHLFDHNQGIYYMRPYFRFDSILLGCWLAACFSRMGPQEKKRVGSRIGLVPLLVCLAILLIWTMTAEQLAKPVFITVQMALTLVVFTNVILATSRAADRILRMGWLRFLGKISYGLYLWQQLFLVNQNPGWGILVQFPLNLAAPIIIAMLSYRFVESPFLRRKDKYASV
jgi:peptidoglycan/LPS O-acetylase OafA/YrhL